MASDKTNGKYNLNIDLLTMLGDLKRRWYVILLCACIGAMGCYVYANETYTPYFTTSGTFYVTSQTNSASESDTSNAGVFITIIGSDQLKKQVTDDMKTGTLPGTITGSQVPNTNFITITTTGTSPYVSYKIMETVLADYHLFADNVIPGVVLQQLEGATVPSAASTVPNTKKMAINGFIVGALLAAFVLLLMSFFRDTIKKESEIKEKIATHLLVSIPAEKKRCNRLLKKKKKMSLNINNPIQSMNFIESYKRLRAYVEMEHQHYGYKTFVIASTLENEGKTTVASNLAIALAKKDFKVLLLDLDLRKPAVFKFFELNIEKEKTLSSYITGDSRLNDVIQYNKSLNLYYIADNTSHKNSLELISSESVPYLISAVRERFDYVIIDTPPLAMVSDTEEILDHSDAALLVVRRDTAKAIAVNDSIDIISDTHARLLGCVYNDDKSLINKSHYGYRKYGYGYNYSNGYGRQKNLLKIRRMYK